MKAKHLQRVIDPVAGPEAIPGPRIKKPKAPAPPELGERAYPAELRQLVKLHKRWTRTAVAWEQSITDRTWKDEENPNLVVFSPCLVPQEIRDDIGVASKRLRKHAKRLEADMLKKLKKIPIYTEFLADVYGFGEVTCSYLVSMVDIAKAVKVSNLIRYCGYAVDAATGRRERRRTGSKASGGEGTYNDELKMRIWQGMIGMRKACGKYGKTSKYMTRWTDAKHTSQSQRGTIGSPDKFADDKGRAKATDLLLWDLYVMWRTLEGLPVWPDKWAVERGYFHGGDPVWGGPRVLTLDEAKEMVK